MLLAVAPEFRGRRAVIAAGFCFYPILAFALLAGGLPGLPAVSTERWGGLTLTMLVGMSAFVLSFPLAVLLALARTSSLPALRLRSEEHTSELQSLMRISYAVFRLQTKKLIYN